MNCGKNGVDIKLKIKFQNYPEKIDIKIIGNSNLTNVLPDFNKTSGITYFHMKFLPKMCSILM